MSVSTRLTSRPRVEGAPLIAIGVLLAATIALSGWSAHEKRTQASTPVVAVLQMRALQFLDAADGSVSVRDAVSGESLAPIVGEAGFARGVLRGLAQARLRQGGRPHDSFELRHESDGGLKLSDPITGRVVDLTVFGPSNVAAFQQYLEIRTRSYSGDRR
jgi:putative photosynthetic complex assembly protein